MTIIGIDLGTTNSVLAHYTENGPITINIDESQLLPSVIHLSDSGFVVGKTAKNLLVLEPDRTISSVKRKMGQDTLIPIGDQQLRPEELSSLILKKIKAVAIEQLKFSDSEPVRTVITVPAYFSEEQRKATNAAAELAGLKVERIINEPTAAALAYGMSNLKEATFIVYDLGGGTFDVSVIESDQGMVEVLATTGNNQLGGDDFDHALASHIWANFIKKNKLPNLEQDKFTSAKLIRLAELAKINLSEQEETSITESFFLQHKDINYHIDQTLTRSEFEGLIRSYIEQTVQLLQQAVKEAKLAIHDLDGIILVGGSSRIPLITEVIEKATNILPQLIDNPDESVAHGAAVQGAIIDNKDIKTILVDITPYSLGVGCLDGESEAEMMDLIMNNEDDKLSKDYVPNLKAEPLISKNTPLPAKNKKIFYAGAPFQEKFIINIYQGEKNRYSENRTIGECLLEVENPPENPKIEVSFQLDINGILNVEARETETNAAVHATFKSSRGQRIRDNALDNLVMAATDDSENLLVKRAKKLLDKKGLNEEDKSELEELLEQYQKAALNNDTASLENTKLQLIDLLFFLEKN